MMGEEMRSFCWCPSFGFIVTCGLLIWGGSVVLNNFMTQVKPVEIILFIENDRNASEVIVTCDQGDFLAAEKAILPTLGSNITLTVLVSRYTETPLTINVNYYNGRNLVDSKSFGVLVLPLTNTWIVFPEKINGGIN